MESNFGKSSCLKHRGLNVKFGQRLLDKNRHTLTNDEARKWQRDDAVGLGRFEVATEIEHGQIFLVHLFVEYERVGGLVPMEVEAVDSPVEAAAKLLPRYVALELQVVLVVDTYGLAVSLAVVVAQLYLHVVYVKASVYFEPIDDVLVIVAIQGDAFRTILFVVLFVNGGRLFVFAIVLFHVELLLQVSLRT